MAYQLNNSTSKQQFSFGKQQRFKQTASTQDIYYSSTPLCYDVKNKKQRKGGVLSRAPRDDWTRTSVVSPASKYRIRGCFDENALNGKGSTMGIGRGSTAHSNQSYITPNQNPGPGSYHNEATSLSHSNSGFTIGCRTRAPCGVIFLNDLVEEVPGPGRYHIHKEPSVGGKMTTCSERFKTTNKDRSPGPGQYDAYRSQKSLNGSFDRQSKQHASFSREARTTFLDQTSKRSCAPGPGRYKVFSEFTVPKATVVLRD